MAKLMKRAGFTRMAMHGAGVQEKGAGMKVVARLMDARNTIEGKIAAILVSLVLMFSCFNVAIFADTADAAEDGTETAPTEENVEQPEATETESGSNEGTTEVTESEDEATNEDTEEVPSDEVTDEDEALTEKTEDEELTEEEVTEEDIMTASEEPATWDATSGTLTISNVEGLTGDDVAGILDGLQIVAPDVQHLVLNNVGTIATESFGYNTPPRRNDIRNVETITITGKGSIATNTFRDLKLLDTVSIDGIDAINPSAFLSTSVKHVVIRNVGSVAQNAFYNPPNLETVVMSDIGSIGKDVFHNYGTTSLAEVTLSNLSISDQMFMNHNKLTTLNLSGIDSIGFQAFMNCTGLTSLDLNDKVKVLGISAFYGCTGITELDLDGVEIENTAFYGCTGLTKVTVSNCETIGQQAFTGCTGITKATIKNVKTIGVQAFSVYGDNVQPACTALKAVTMNNVGTIGTNAFASCKALKSVDMNSIDTIGQYAFYNCTGLETVGMNAVRFIDNYAFWACKNLTAIDSLKNVTERINGFAFYGCEKLTGLTVDDLAKMGYVGTSEAIMARVQAILAGKFQLDDPNTIKELQLEGWAAGAIGKSEGWTIENYDNATQLMEQAQWSDVENGVAEVKLDAYYTGQKQMDYIFVADLSASMAQLGNEEDANARFYDMQSKLFDMTGKLLDTPGYDCQVALVTFGGYLSASNKGTAEVQGFTDDADTASGYIAGLAPLNENTDYALGLNEVKGLLDDHDSNRNVVVVFLSDGRPTYDGSTKLGTVPSLKANDEKLADLAQQIKDAGVQGIYGVLHSPGATAVEYAHNAMNAVCDKYYTSTDTESFGEAMNGAFSSVYPTHTVKVPVNSEQFIVSGLPTDGSVTYDEEAGVITWTLGMPFTQHTLSYTLTLKDELKDLEGTHTYNINKGDAAFDNESAASVGLELTLERTVIASDQDPERPVTPVTPDVPNTPAPNLPVGGGAGAGAGAGAGVLLPFTAAPAVAAPAADAVPTPETIADEGTPLAQAPEAQPATETIADDENPLSTFDKPVCGTHMWMFLGIILTVIYGAAVALRRLSDTRDIEKMDKDLTGSESAPAKQNAGYASHTA